MNNKTESIKRSSNMIKPSPIVSVFTSLKRFIKPKSTLFRLTLGLSSMVVSLLLLATIAGLVPDENTAIREGRGQLAEAVAINSSIFITVADLRRMEANLGIVVERNKDLVSAAVRRTDGKVLVDVGGHQENWIELREGESRNSQIVVPIFESSNEWGQVELAFEPLVPDAWYGYFYQPVFLLITFMSLSCFAFFYFYMRKMLKQLDPSQAIPDRVRSALDTMAEGLLVIDAKQDIVLANLAFTKLANETSDELMGRKIISLPWMNKDNEVVDSENSPWAKTLNDGVTRTSNMIRLEVGSGESKTFMTNCSPILSGNGKPAGVLVSFDDVTELEQKEIELRISKDEAEQANRSKSEFLANMSHEIRTPMNAILGFSEVLKRGYDKNNEDSIRYLNTISSSGNHLLGLINDILDLSKVESGKIELEIKQTAAHQIINEVVQIMKIKAIENNIYLRFEPACPLPEIIETDAGKFRQIITNLVGNAIKFTKEGGVTITTNMVGLNNKKQLVIDIIDTGIGMTTDQANEIFNPFTQADSSITRRFGGTGLGLTISKRFAAALGGDIEVSSILNEGSKFSVTIDVGNISSVKQLSIEELLEENVTVEATRNNWQFNDASILVVDDGEENRELLKVVLEDAGLDVTTAENGQVALDKLEEKNFDVVFMDVQMPVMDGYTAVGLMRERGYDLPVVAMTADAMLGAKQKCLDAGYSEYMSKPVDIDRLMEWLIVPLNAKAVDESEITTAEKDTSTIASSPSDDNKLSTKIYSSLPMDNDKFRVIVEKFILRLEEQMLAIHAAYQQRDYVELKRLGHWLKGSSGSVGFHQLVEPAKEFEQAAIDQNDLSIELTIKSLQKLYDRISLDENNSVKDDHIQKENKKLDIPERVVCNLDDLNPKLRPVIEKFTYDLSEKVAKLGADVAQQNYEAIEKFAHWLKASAGSVGFSDFTVPARELQEQGKLHQDDLISETVEAIKTLETRIVLSEYEENGIQVKGRA